MINTKQTLALGTVQFGLNYGISNKWGPTSEDELARILKIAEQEKILLLDCAVSYGNSLERIESILPMQNDFRIVYKVSDVEKLNQNKTLEKLEKLISRRKMKLDTLMFHHASDILLNDARRIIENVPSETKIGISVYDEYEIIDILSSEQKIDVIQLPINVFDQRLLQSDILHELNKQSIEIHARSVFLQGLLLMNSSDLPVFFEPIKNHFLRYEIELEKKGLTHAEYALSFVKNIKEIDKVIVGVNNSTQLLELIASYKKIEKLDIDFSIFALRESRYIDPRKW